MKGLLSLARQVQPQGREEAEEKIRAINNAYVACLPVVDVFFMPTERFPTKRYQVYHYFRWVS
jgi:hypothetical protein